MKHNIKIDSFRFGGIKEITQGDFLILRTQMFLYSWKFHMTSKIIKDKKEQYLFLKVNKDKRVVSYWISHGRDTAPEKEISHEHDLHVVFPISEAMYIAKAEMIEKTMKLKKLIVNRKFHQFLPRIKKYSN